jgi:hypothetical protein
LVLRRGIRPVTRTGPTNDESSSNRALNCPEDSPSYRPDQAVRKTLFPLTLLAEIINGLDRSSILKGAHKSCRIWACRNLTLAL